MYLWCLPAIKQACHRQEMFISTMYCILFFYFSRFYWVIFDVDIFYIWLAWWWIFSLGFFIFMAGSILFLFNFSLCIFLKVDIIWLFLPSFQCLPLKEPVIYWSIIFTPPQLTQWSDAEVYISHISTFCWSSFDSLASLYKMLLLNKQMY